MSKRVLIKPYVTEKTTRQMAEDKYTFVVRLDATKPAIKQAVEQAYKDEGVRVTKVRTQIVPGKRRRQFREGSMIEGRTSGFKKAIVELDPEGGSIDFFDAI
ncbi:50S ribosomal protein L23 [Salisaeta longa]|uniref:50S ribosomal protein L23 n=1 Tax=Salisaeta longa TaxID=503170 RepID=UPI0003B4C672|nr:50S ribosomal protein L23 [Salisaeta longa]